MAVFRIEKNRGYTVMSNHHRRNKEKLFLQYGYEKTSIEKIARQAKISKSNLYNYFKSKDEIFNRLTDKAAHEFRKVIEYFASNQF